MQYVLALLAGAIAIVAWRRPAWAGAAVPGFLAGLWLWSGIAYHLTQFTAVNPAAYLFGAAFILQGLLFAWAAGRGTLVFGPPVGAGGIIGAAGVAYALLVYPALGAALGHHYPAAPTFGAPCPSAIFTFAVLLWARPRFPIHLLLIPALWAVLAAPMALRWGVVQDAAMPVLAVVAVAMLVHRNRAVPAPGSARSPGSSADVQEGYSH
jgi:hypothetical protein